MAKISGFPFLWFPLAPPVTAVEYATPVDIIWHYLVSVAGLFTDPDDSDDWPLFNEFLPEDVSVDDDIAAAFSTSGILHGKDMDGSQHQHYGIQLRARARTAGDAYEKLKNVMDDLLTVSKQDVAIPGEDTYWIHSISQTTDIIPIQLDEKERTHYVVNVIVSYSKL